MCSMATRLRSKVTRRPSLPLTERDEADLATLRANDEYLEALARLADTPLDHATASESALLHAIFEIGMNALRDSAEADGYAQIAAESAAENGVRRATARRRLPTWASD